LVMHCSRAIAVPPAARAGFQLQYSLYHTGAW
jgi:hypothetical protein